MYDLYIPIDVEGLVIHGIHGALMLLLWRGFQVIRTVWSWPTMSDFLVCITEISEPKQLRIEFIQLDTSVYIETCFWCILLNGIILCVCVWALHDVTCLSQHIATTVWLLCDSNCLDRGAAACSFGAKLSPKACRFCDLGRRGSVDRCCQAAFAVLYRSKLQYERIWYVPQDYSLSCVGCWGPSCNVAHSHLNPESL